MSRKLSEWSIVALWHCLLMLMPLQQPSAEANISIVGLFKDRAVVVIDGRQRLLRAGEEARDGVKLISSTSREAVLEINGARTRLGLGNHIGNHYASRAEPPAVRIWSNANGMFTTVGSINGYPVRFLVDTGATMIAMNATQAKRLGLDLERDSEPQWVTTASGVERAYRVTLDRVKVGDIELRNVESAVLPGDFPTQILLGMSFLNRLDMQRQGTLLELRKKY